MNQRTFLRVFVFAAVALSVSLCTAAAQGSSGVRADASASPDLREHLDNPPAPAAEPIPGAPPAPRPRFGRFTNVQVNVAYDGSNIPGDAANETTIAVDPTNPMRMLIGWRQFDSVSSNFRQAGWAYTTDEGRTWTFPGVLTPGTFRSDPVVGCDYAGHFYYLSLESDFTTDLFKSTDGGTTWGFPTYA
jgi:hypothetical protein